MTIPDHRRLLTAESRSLANVADGDLGLDVAHLPGWTLQTLVGHAGWVLRYAAACLAAPADEPPRRSSVPEPPVGAEVLAWYAEARDQLLDRLDTVEPDSLHPTFTGPQPVTWWVRRLAHELSLHRWDAQAAVGAADPIDPELARDGIDELFEVFVPRRLDLERLGATGETVHLHATDLEGEWMCVLRADGVEWSHGHGKGDVAARGPVADLLLLLWGRIPPSRLELFGDATILDRWQDAAHF